MRPITQPRHPDHSRHEQCLLAKVDASGLCARTTGSLRNCWRERCWMACSTSCVCSARLRLRQARQRTAARCGLRTGSALQLALCTHCRVCGRWQDVLTHAAAGSCRMPKERAREVRGTLRGVDVLRLGTDIASFWQRKLRARHMLQSAMHAVNASRLAPSSLLVKCMP